MINTDLLRDKIYGKFHSQAAFSRKIGWGVNRINKILTGKSIPDVNDCADIASVLNLSREEYIGIFIPCLSPNGDKQNESA
jgi:transcriptional regulator with XRE-family HTH domain